MPLSLKIGSSLPFFLGGRADERPFPPFLRKGGLPLFFERRKEDNKHELVYIGGATPLFFPPLKER